MSLFVHRTRMPQYNRTEHHKKEEEEEEEEVELSETMSRDE